jgi:uncharacterized protein (TIGR00645 family)
VSNRRIEILIEKYLFASRWLMAPIYLGLSFALIGLIFSFAQEFLHFATNIFVLDPTHITLALLSLIDLSFVGNLLLIVIFSGYENFVSKFDIDEDKDQPDWKSTVDFATLKLKLISSIVAISGIHLLKIFMSEGNINIDRLKWLLITHIVFVSSGVLLALMDFISAKSKNLKS